MIFVYTLVGSHNSLVFCYWLFAINWNVRTIVSLPSVSLNVTSSQCFSVDKKIRRFISLAFSTFLCTLARPHDIVLLFLRFSVWVHSYDQLTLLSVSLYVSMFIRYKSCLLNVCPYVTAILVDSFTLLHNLLSHCNGWVCPFGILPYITHFLTELVLSNNVSPQVSSCVFY